MANPERVYEQYLYEADVLVARAEGERHNQTAEETGGWMVDVAVGRQHFPCDQPGGTCLVCEMVVTEWERAFAGLPRYVRYAVVATLAHLRVKRPTYAAVVGNY